MAEPTNHLHGRLGVFCGGDWVPMAEASGPAWGADIEDMVGTCSESKRCQDLPPNEYDVVVVGAGCVGSSVARELAKYRLKVLVLEKADDVTQGATKGNSGIVHAGYDDEPGSVRAKFCPAGNRMFPALDKDLKFGFQRNGSLVVARSPQDEDTLRELLQRGETNGVQGLKIIDRAELRRVEPNISPDATAALFAPSAGVVIPFEFTIALAENAASNGVEFRCRRQVTAIAAGTNNSDEKKFVLTCTRWHPSLPPPKSSLKSRGAVAFGLGAVMAAGVAAGVAALDGGGGSGLVWRLAPVALAMLVLLAGLLAWGLKTSRGGGGLQDLAEEEEVVTAKFVVNAAGLFSDKIANMVGDSSFTIKPRIGEYLLMKRPAITAKEEPPLCRHIAFPCPGPMGKGILVQPTLWGNLCLGPTAHDFEDKERRTAVFDEEARGESKSDIMAFILAKCRELVPSFNEADIIHSFAGVRAKNSTGDWVVRPSAREAQFVHCAGVDSPGLAGSPAVALEVVRLLGAAGLELSPNPHFNPKRRPYIVPKGNWKRCLRGDSSGKEVTIKKDFPEDPSRNVVCRCELVTEEEVVDAVRRGKSSSLKVETTQQVRKRTRAGMGWCQGQYCQPKVASLIARELGLGSAAEAAAAKGSTGVSSSTTALPPTRGGGCNQSGGMQGPRVSYGGVEVRDWPESSLLESQHQHADNK